MAVKIGIVAGEASGDLLGAHLIRAIRQYYPDSEFVGIAGPKMLAERARSLFPIENLSVRGYIEVLKHLPSLLKLRRELLCNLLAEKPNIFIGIDAPDFNFWLEKRLKRKGIPVIHYVSPSIWAWRKGRIGKIKQAISHMLALFPFEPALYEQADIPVSYVGHPLADMLPLEPNVAEARESLKLKPYQLVIAMLPGSRQSEVMQHADLLIKTAKKVVMESQGFAPEDIVFLVPLVTRETRTIFDKALFEFQSSLNEQDVNPNITVMFGHSHEAMQAADLVIVASGTATLEAALLKKPMIIIYRMSSLSWQILKRMHLQSYVGLPNVLAERFVVPELLQHDATPEKVAETALKMLTDKDQLADIRNTFTGIHQSLRQNTAEKAAQAILKYL